MDVRIKNENAYLAIELSGQVDFESAERLRRVDVEWLKLQPLLIDCRQLAFVGSTNILGLFEWLGELLHKHRCELALTGLRNEFRRLLVLSVANDAKIFENRESAQASLSSGVNKQWGGGIGAQASRDQLLLIDDVLVDADPEISA